MNVATAKRKYRAYKRDTRTLGGLSQRRDLPPDYVIKRTGKMFDDGPAITLGGIIELCEQGATVHVYDEKIVITLDTFVGVCKLWPNDEHLVIDTLLPWIHCT